MRPDTIDEVPRLRSLRHCTCLLLRGLPAVAAAQQQVVSTQGTGYLVFLRGNPVGREIIAFNRDQKQISITSQDTEVRFPLKVDPACPTGSHKNLFVSVLERLGNEVIPHSLGAGGILRIVPARKPSVAAVGTRATARN